MPPPFQFTGDPNADWIIFIVGALICLYWLRALRLAREGARRFLRSLAIAFLVFLGCQFVLSGMQVQDSNRVLLSGIVAAGVLYRRAGTRRSRSIPASVKQAVIARDLKEER